MLFRLSFSVLDSARGLAWSHHLLNGSLSHDLFGSRFCDDGLSFGSPCSWRGGTIHVDSLVDAKGKSVSASWRSSSCIDSGRDLASDSDLGGSFDWFCDLFDGGVTFSNNEFSSNHWHFFIIFAKISIVLIIIHIVEKSNLLLVLRSIILFLNISEILKIEWNTSHLSKVLTLLDRWIFWNDTKDRVWISKLLCGQVGNNCWVGRLLWFEHLQKCLVHIDVVHNCGRIEALGDIISWIKLNLINSDR